MTLKSHLLSGLILIMLLCTNPVLLFSAEIAPGLDKCLNSAETTGMTIGCYNNALEYLLPKLENAYSMRVKYCNNESNKQYCINKLKTAYQNWLKYRDTMRQVLLGEKDPELNDYDNTSLLSAIRFEVKSVNTLIDALNWD